MFVCRGPNYIEVDVDVSSSRSAAHVVGLVQGALKSLVIDIAILLEGRSPVNPLSTASPLTCASLCNTPPPSAPFLADTWLGRRVPD
jgi:hypothetical protein